MFEQSIKPRCGGAFFIVNNGIIGYLINMQEVAKYSGCFICGDENNYGLKVRFYYDDGVCLAEYTAENKFEGYLGILHGGVTAALLDEVMIKALLARNIYVMTVEMTVRFKKAVNTGDKLHLKGNVIGEKGRLYTTEGIVETDYGEIVATAQGKYLLVNEDMQKRLTQSLNK